MTAEIIAIGDEILIGQVVDTNSSFIASRLNYLGIDVTNISAISDTEIDIKESVERALNRSDLTIITGGLGPTNDDITKKCLADIFNTDLVLSQEILDHIKNLFSGRNIDLNKQNREQALVPEDCKILTNVMGTAPGMWFSKDNRHVISLPGVPFEMKALIEKEVIPRIKDISIGASIVVNKSVNIYDIPESVLAEKLEEWESSLPEHISLAYLPGPEKVKLRLTAKGEDRGSLEKQIDNFLSLLTKIIPSKIISSEKDSLEVLINKMLIDRDLSLSTAESCTGGNIAHLVTSVSGSSKCFKGSVVSYSNQVKQNILGVSKNDIENHGAVSQIVVEQMAKGVRILLGTDYSVATSGIAGPTGGTEDKPVGTVWIAVASKERVISERFNFSKSRERNIGKSSAKALEMLMKEIQRNDKEI